MNALQLSLISMMLEPELFSMSTPDNHLPPGLFGITSAERADSRLTLDQEGLDDDVKQMCPSLLRSTRAASHYSRLNSCFCGYVLVWFLFSFKRGRDLLWVEIFYDTHDLNAKSHSLM